jgi:hypothetical protein
VGLRACALSLRLVREFARLAATEKLGRVRTCRSEPAGFDALQQWIRDHRSTWERSLDRLGALLEQDQE